MLTSDRVETGENTSDLAEVRRLFDEARVAWPGIELRFEAFAARLSGGGRTHTSDLYLACACTEQSSPALAEFEHLFLRAVRDAVARIDRSQDFIAEIQQILRERLLVGPDAKIREYRGGGALASWIRTAAVRTALNLRRRAKHEIEGEVGEPFEQLLDPAIVLLRQRHLPEIDAALRTAIAALEPRQRLLLQFYYVDGLPLSKIAALERVGTSTVFRRMNAATQAVLARIKLELGDKLQLSSQSLDSLLGHVRDDIDLSLSEVLGAPA